MIKEILADLVRIDSVSTRSNAEIVKYLEQRCEALGLITRRYPYTDEHGVEKINLFALSHDVQEVELALVGHTDTVPYDPNWSEATNLTERDGKLYGRGTCDTKGFIAAALSAVETVKTTKPLSSLGGRQKCGDVGTNGNEARHTDIKQPCLSPLQVEA